MSKIIKTQLIKIGNSHGVRIPKIIREQIGLTYEIELEVQGDHLIVRPGTAPRAGWAQGFQRMAEQHDDMLLDADHALTAWDATEWEWS